MDNPSLQTPGEQCPPKAAFPPQMETPQNAETASCCPTTEEDESKNITQENEKEVAVVDTKEKRFEAGDHVYQWCSVLGIPGVFQHHGIVIHVEDLAGEGDDDQLLTIADFSNLLLKDNREQENTDDTMDEMDESLPDTASELSTPQAPQQQQTGSLTGTTFLRSGSSSVDSKSSKINQYGGLRVYKTTSTKDSKWHKVTYSDRWFATHLWKRSGTCTPVASDPPQVVLKRVHFLLGQAQYNNNNFKEDQSESILPKFHSIFANCEW